MRTRAERRKTDFKKAVRKQNICEHNTGDLPYDNLHQYSKNKIHSSTPKYAKKSNSENNHTHADKVKIDSMSIQFEEV